MADPTGSAEENVIQGPRLWPLLLTSIMRSVRPGGWMGFRLARAADCGGCV